MIAVYLAPFYALLQFVGMLLVLFWIHHIAPATKNKIFNIIFAVVFMFCSLSMGVGFFMDPGKLQHALNFLGNCWLAITLYGFMVLVPALILYTIIKIVKKWKKGTPEWSRLYTWTGWICLLLVAMLCTVGFVNARIIRTTDYQVAVDKDGGDLDELNMVLISDMHMGYNVGTNMVQKMVDAINACNADVVVIAGDIFDNEYDALDDPDALIDILSGIQSKYGVYAVYGNHDVDEKILCGFTFDRDEDTEKVSDERMDAFLEKAGITLLRDETVLIDDSFYIFGRPDMERPGRDITVRKTVAEELDGLDTEKPIIVLDHEPNEIHEAAEAGADLYLCGHVHDGQTFPLNIIQKFLWENPCGYLQVDQMHNIVTSGAGIWGPAIRLGTRAEICNITVTFK